MTAFHPERPVKTVAVVGAGAMGCYFAARLAEAGAEVILIDVDAPRLAAIQESGVVVCDDEGERAVRVAAMRAQEARGPVDLIVLFTKGLHSEAAIASVAHLAPGAYALTLQNGLGNAEAIAQVVAPERILVGVTDVPCDLEGPARVASHGEGQVRLGPFAGAPPAVAAEVASLFQRAGLKAAADPQVITAVWEKVAFNAALNALAAVTGLTVGGMNHPPGRRIAAAVTAEVAATAAAAGVPVDPARIAAKIDFALTHHGGHKASMLQDRLAGRRTEIEQINGAVARVAEAHGLSTPVTSALADLVRLMETER